GHLGSNLDLRRQRAAFVEHEVGAEIERLARGEPPGLEVEVAHLAPALLLAVLHDDGRVVDFEASDGWHFGRAGLLRLLLLAFALAEIGPVLPALFVSDEANARAVEPHVADFDFAA